MLDLNDSVPSATAGMTPLTGFAAFRLPMLRLRLLHLHAVVSTIGSLGQLVAFLHGRGHSRSAALGTRGLGTTARGRGGPSGLGGGAGCGVVCVWDADPGRLGGCGLWRGLRVVSNRVDCPQCDVLACTDGPVGTVSGIERAIGAVGSGSPDSGDPHCLLFWGIH